MKMDQLSFITNSLLLYLWFQMSKHVKVAETIEEATKLLAVGYEYVSTMDNKQIYRKRK